MSPAPTPPRTPPVAAAAACAAPAPHPRAPPSPRRDSLDPAPHAERLLGSVVDLPCDHPRQRGHGVRELHVLAPQPRELGGDEERLPKEPLHPPRPRHEQLVVL